jgi:hypothetical protein
LYIYFYILAILGKKNATISKFQRPLDLKDQSAHKNMFVVSFTYIFLDCFSSLTLNDVKRPLFRVSIEESFFTVQERPPKIPLKINKLEMENALKSR